MCWYMYTMIAVHEDFGSLLFKSLVGGRDGRTQGAVLRVVSTGTRESTLQQPLQRLYSLETSDLNPDKEEETNKEKGVLDKEGEEDHNPMNARSKIAKETCGSKHPKRAAAQRSRDRTLAIALSEQEDYSD